MATPTKNAGTVMADETMMRGKTICPFMRSGLKAGILGFDGATAPQSALTDVLGGGPNGFGRVARFFAKHNHTTPETPAGRYDPLNLLGSRGAHPGSSRMLGAEGFDARRFEEFTAHARTGPDGRRYMTADDFGVAIAESLKRDPQARVGPTDILFKNDMRNSAGEFGLLLEGFGRELPDGPDRGRKAVLLDEMRLLFEKSEFPPGWRETVKRASALGWAVTSFGVSGFGGIYGAVRKAYAKLNPRS
jgi:hypothetical protein